MAKTQLTLDMEEALYFYCLEQSEIVVEEVSTPDSQGIVDTLACRARADGTYEWRCYELKASKSDFKSGAKISFIGHYNYYCMPKALYHAVKEDIPKHAGAMVYLPHDNREENDFLAKGSLSIVKKATKQELLVDDNQLMMAFLHSLFREVRKAKKLEKGLQLYGSEALYRELAKRHLGYDQNHPDRAFYQTFAAQMEQDAVKELQEELAATVAENNELRDRLRQNPRMTEPYL